MGLKDLYRDEKEAVRRGDLARQIESLNNIGDHFRYRTNELEKAIEAYEKAAQLVERNKRQFAFDGSFSERGLAEIYSELGNRVKALLHAEKYRNLSELSGKHSTIQLSLHVTAWIFEKCHKGKEDLREAVRWIVKSLEYLDAHGSDIDRDRASVRSGGDAEKRKAKLYRLYAEVLLLLGDVKTAKQKWLAALNYARRQKDEELKHELYITQMEFPGEDKIAVAFNLMKTASKKEQGPSIMEYENQKVLHGGIGNCLRPLTACYQEHGSVMQTHFPDEYDLLLKRIVTVYKYTEARRILKSSEESEKFRIYETLGDLITQYLETVDESQNKKTLLNLAVDEYFMMFKSSQNDEQKIKALTSLAVTLLEDLHDPAAAHGHFLNVLELQKNIGAPERQVLDTRLSLFNCECQLGSKSEPRLTEDFEELERTVSRSTHKIELYSIWSRFHAATAKGAELHQAAQDVCEDDSEEVELDEEPDLVEGSDEQILKRCLEMLKKANTEENLVKKKNEKNEKGETRLHEEARNESSPLLKTLIEYGYSLDERDNGGWTPLSEAVNHGCIENVRLLLRYGADPNIPSKEGWEGSEFGGKVTPLMEACENGYLEVAALLMMHNASCTYRNEGNQTALDFLRRYIDSLDSSDADLPLARELEERMLKIQQSGEEPLAPPPVRQRPRADSSDSRRLRSEEEEEIIPARRPTSPASSRHSKSSSHSSRGSTGERKRKAETITSSTSRRRIAEEDEHELEVTFEHVPTPRRTRFPSPMEDRRKPSVVVVEQTRPHIEASPRHRTESPRRHIDLQPRQKADPLPRQRVDPTPRQQSPSTSSDVVLRIRFDKQNPASASNRMLMLPKSSTIGQVAARLVADLGHQFQVTLSQDGFELSEEIKVSTFEPNLDFDCTLVATSSAQLYTAKTKDPIEEVIRRLTLFDDEGHLDLEGTSQVVLKEVVEIVEKKSRVGSSLVLSRQILDVATARRLSTRIQEAQKLIANSVFEDDAAIEAAFPEQLQLEVLDLSCTICKRQEVVADVLGRCKNLKILSLAALRTSLTSFGQSPIADRLLELHQLRELDLSYAPWLDDWPRLLSSMDHLSSLSMVSADISDVSFEVTWLPNLERLNATDCSLNWTTFGEWAVVNDVTYINLSKTKIDSDTVKMVVEAREESMRRLKLVLRFCNLKLQGNEHVQLII